MDTVAASKGKIKMTRVSCAIYIGLVLVCKPLWAGNLSFTPSVSLAYDNTDNLTLDETNEVSDNITEVRPAFELLYQSNRVVANAQYELQSLYYQDNSDNDETFQQLDSFISSELFDDIFWLNISNNISQRNISDTADQQQDNIFANQNVTDVNDLVVQPLLRFRNNNINYQLIGNIAEQNFDSDDTPTINQLDSSSSNYGISIESDNNTRLNWGINFFDSQTEFEDDSENTFKNTEAFINLAVSNQILSSIILGKDDNDFATINPDILDAEYWSVNLTWNPNNRLSFIVSGGERFDSSDNGIALTYQAQRLSLTISKNQELISNGLNDIDPLNNPDTVINPQNNDVQLRNLSSITIDYQQRKIRLNLSYTYDDRESQSIVNGEEIDENIIFGLIWQLQSRTSISLSYNRTDDEVPNVLLAANNRLDKLTISTIEFTRLLSLDSELSVLIRSQKRESTDNTFNYNENGYQVNFTHRF